MASPGFRYSGGVWRSSCGHSCQRRDIGTFRACILGNPDCVVIQSLGTLDLLYAFYQGLIGVRIDPELLGSAFFIPTVVVPPLLVTHGLIFWLLLRF
jgi:hypothetical protein